MVAKDKKDLSILTTFTGVIFAQTSSAIDSKYIVKMSFECRMVQCQKELYNLRTFLIRLTRGNKNREELFHSGIRSETLFCIVRFVGACASYKDFFVQANKYVMVVCILGDSSDELGILMCTANIRKLHI